MGTASELWLAQDSQQNMLVSTTLAIFYPDEACLITPEVAVSCCIRLRDIEGGPCFYSLEGHWEDSDIELPNKFRVTIDQVRRGREEGEVLYHCLPEQTPGCHPGLKGVEMEMVYKTLGTRSADHRLIDIFYGYRIWPYEVSRMIAKVDGF